MGGTFAHGLQLKIDFLYLVNFLCNKTCNCLGEEKAKRAGQMLQNSPKIDYELSIDYRQISK